MRGAPCRVAQRDRDRADPLQRKSQRIGSASAKKNSEC